MKAVRDGKSAGRVDGTPQTALANLQQWRRSKTLTRVQQVVVNLRSDVAALAEATQTLVQAPRRR
jgi:hypothetical protein